MKKLCFLFLLVAACTKNEIPEEDNLGVEASEAGVIQALSSAQGSINFENGFRIGDKGIIVREQKLFQQSRVLSAKYYEVTDVTEDDITGVWYEKGSPEKPAAWIIEKKPKPAQVSTFLWRFLEKLPVALANAGASLLKDFSRVSIQPSTAVGDETPFKVEVMGLQGLHPMVEATSKFYGLKVTPHKYVVANCGQVVDCTINSTKVEYNQVISADGKVTRLYWSYEISREIPGLFSVWFELPKGTSLNLERCVSETIEDKGQKYPLTECTRLADFAFGGK